MPQKRYPLIIAQKETHKSIKKRRKAYIFWKIIIKQEIKTNEGINNTNARNNNNKEKNNDKNN